MVCYQNVFCRGVLELLAQTGCFSIVYAGFLTQGFLEIIYLILFDLGRERNLIKRHFVFKNQVSLVRKLYILEQGLLHHKRTGPVKGNAIQNRKESRNCFVERRILLRHWLRCVQTIQMPFEVNSCTKKKDRSLKHATLFGHKQLRKR